jgi:hypothetical protein
MPVLARFCRAAFAAALAVSLLATAVPLARAGHTIAVLPARASQGEPPPLLDAFVADAVERAGHTALSGEALRQRLPPDFDPVRCRSGQCLADAVRQAGADEGIALDVTTQGTATVLSLRRIGADGRVIDQRTQSIAGSVVAVLDGARQVVGASLGDIAPRETLAGAADAAGESPGIKFRVGVNALSNLMNDDIAGTPVAGMIDEGSYGLHLDFTLPSRERGLFGKFYLEEYVSFRALKFVSRGEDPDEPDYKYAESLQAYGVLYGRRYYLNPEFDGLALGWYAGLALLLTDGREWFQPNPSLYNVPYQETLVAPLAAFELFYKLQIKGVFIEPNVLLAINTDSGGYGFEVLPMLVVGYQF